MAAAPASLAEAGLAPLCDRLHEAGFDLVAPFLVKWYNEEEHIAHLPASHKLPGDGESLAVIVANSRSMWEPFLAFVRARLAADPTWLEKNPHALDAYTEEVVQQALASAGVPESEVVYAAETLETTGRAVSVTTCAAVAGLAFYHGSLMRSVHPVLGPWIAYRAVVVFHRLRPNLPLPPPAADPCSAAEWERVRVLQDDCFAKWAPDDPDGSEEDWARLVDVVRCFEAGKEHAYSAEQLTFHYGGFNEARRVEHLRRCVTEAPPGGA